MNGLIFIPDITGFTEFVRKIDNELGGTIIRELLCEIIDNNYLELELSEIEGDAVLFYKLGDPLSLPNIFSAFNSMQEAFNKKYQILRLQHRINAQLSLKFILHYGEMSVYHVKGFKKLYGQVIIESHRLLKNGSHNSNYILITEDYMKALRNISGTFQMGHLNPGKYSSQLFSELREIGYYFFNYGARDASSFYIPSTNIIA